MILVKKLYQILFFLLIAYCKITQATHKPDMATVCEKSRRYYEANPDQPRLDEEQPHFPQEQMLQQKRTALEKRTALMQKAVDENFAKLLARPVRWGLFTGNFGFYNLMGISEEILLKKLAFQDNTKNEVYILDVGCGAGYWGKAAAQFLQKECSDSKKKFHIFSVTGSNELQEKKIVNGNITLYQYNYFKAENIYEEFEKRCHDLDEKFDLIVSHWALQHMVDPLGTVSQLYDLLSPDNGLLLSTGFSFAYYKDSKNYFEGNSNQIFAQSNALCLFCSGQHCKSGGEFLLLKTNTDSLNLPITYTGRAINAGDNSNSFSGMLTEFTKPQTTIPEPEPHLIKIHYYDIYNETTYIPREKLYWTYDTDPANLKILENLIRENNIVFYTGKPFRYEEEPLVFYEEDLK